MKKYSPVNAAAARAAGQLAFVGMVWKDVVCRQGEAVAERRR